jgi:hypothetical protein
MGPSVDNGARGAGDRVVFASTLDNRDIYALPGNIETGGLKPPVRLTYDWTHDGDPHTNVDGKAFVYTTRGGELRHRDVLSGRETVVAGADEIVTTALLSADGTQVLYYAGSKTMSDAIGRWLVRPVSGGPAKEVCGSCGRPRSWSASGKLVLSHHAGKGGGTVTTVRDLESGREIEMVPGMDCSGANLSPDGRWVTFFQRVSPTARKIWIAPFRGLEPIPQSSLIAITSGDAVEREPHWAPSGNLIYFNSLREGFFCIWAQRLDPTTKQPQGAAFPVAHFHSPRLTYPDADTRYLGLSVARDRILIALTESSARIWTIEERKQVN